MKRFLAGLIALPVLIIGLMAVSFLASQVHLTLREYPLAEAEPDWSVLAAEEIPSIVTRDADGDRRITQVWIAAVDSRLYLRTGDTRWFANLKRTPRLELRVGGVMYPCRTQLVTDPHEIDVVHGAFRARYPKRSAFFRSVGVSTNTVILLDCSSAV